MIVNHDIISLNHRGHNMRILDFLDNIFKHSTVATALSGYGVNLLAKIKSIFFKLKPKSRIAASMDIATDIHEIKEIINTSCSEHYKKQTFLHYFYKYKQKFNTDEVDMLNTEFEKSQTAVECNYLLSRLLGLIEALNVK